MCASISIHVNNIHMLATPYYFIYVKFTLKISKVISCHDFVKNDIIYHFSAGDTFRTFECHRWSLVMLWWGTHYYVQPPITKKGWILVEWTCTFTCHIAVFLLLSNWPSITLAFLSTNSLNRLKVFWEKSKWLEKAYKTLISPQQENVP